MNINRDNYEEFFLDFAEGNLTAEEEEVLNDFLKSNPDLEAELKEFDLLQLQADYIHMPGKQKLKKIIPSSTDVVNDLNFEMFAIAYLENDLTRDQKRWFEAFIATDQEYQNGFDLIKKTRLKPEYIPYPAKNKLKRRTNRSSIYKMLVPIAAAAAIALLILVRIDPVLVDSEIAVLPEVFITAESEPKTPEVVKTTVNEKAATIQIIKSSRASVPVTKSNNDQQVMEADGKQEQEGQRTQRIALNNIAKASSPALNVREDKLSPIALPPPKINSSSLALTDRLRYELDRASGIMDEDDVFIWNLAGQGIEGINKLVGSDMSLMASKDKDGSVSGFKFRSRILNVTAPLD